MDFLASRIAEDRKVDLLDLYFAGLNVDHPAIGRHIGRHPELLVACDAIGRPTKLSAPDVSYLLPNCWD
jgi:hypothetical protein